MVYFQCRVYLSLMVCLLLGNPSPVVTSAVHSSGFWFCVTLICLFWMQCSNSKLFSFITVITYPSKVVHFSIEAGELHGACWFPNLWHLNVSFVSPLCFVSFFYCINIISLLDVLIFLTHLFSCALVISDDWKMLSFLQRYVNFSQWCLSRGVGINPTHYSVSDWGWLQSTKIKRLCLCSEFSCIRTDRLQFSLSGQLWKTCIIHLTSSLSDWIMLQTSALWQPNVVVSPHLQKRMCKNSSASSLATCRSNDDCT